MTLFKYPSMVQGLKERIRNTVGWSALAAWKSHPWIPSCLHDVILWLSL